MKKMLTLLALLLGAATTQAQLQNFTEGDIAPDFTITDEHGDTHTLYQYTSAGKYVLLDFFAYWCGPCVQTAPVINQFYKKYGCNGFDVAVLGLEYEGTNAQLESFNGQANLPDDAYPAASGINGNAAAVHSAYNPEAFPTVVLISPSNKFVKIDIWPISDVQQIESAFPSNAITPHTCAAVTGLDDVQARIHIGTSPNPTYDNINISIPTKLITVPYIITNQLGQTVLTGIASQETFKVDMAHLASGVYFMKFAQYTTQAIKIVKQ